MGLPGNPLQSLAEAAQHFGQASIQWPLNLTPKTPFHLGVAALVFVRPHLLSPADDDAEFGIRKVAPFPGENPALSERTHLPPDDGAEVVAWFRPPEIEREYNVDFSCQGVTGDSFVLQLSDGSSESKDVATDDYYGRGIGKLNISANVFADQHQWLSFSLSSDAYWRFVSCEISILPS